MITIEARARRLYTCHECHHLINFQNKKFPEGEFIIYDQICVTCLRLYKQKLLLARVCLVNPSSSSPSSYRTKGARFVSPHPENMLRIIFASFTHKIMWGCLLCQPCASSSAIYTKENQVNPIEIWLVVYWYNS